VIDLDYIIRVFREAQRREYDAGNAVSGYVGEGKSTFTIQLMKKYYKIGSLSEFKTMCNKYIVYSRKDIKRITTTETKQFINVDEAINVLFRRDFMKGDQKDLLRTLDVCRDMGHIFTFIIPSFWALDSHTVQTRLRLWVHVEKQKWAHLSRPLRNQYSIDVWNRTANEKIINKTKSVVNTLNYVSTMGFDPLSPEEYKIYKEVKHAKRLIAQDEKDEKPNVSKSEIARLIKKANSKLSQGEIAKIIKCSQPTVQRALK